MEEEENVFWNMLDKEDKIITKTMINNYVKAGLMKAPKKKKYNRTHIATLFVICILKQIYSINDINELLNDTNKECLSICQAFNSTFSLGWFFLFQQDVKFTHIRIKLLEQVLSDNSLIIILFCSIIFVYFSLRIDFTSTSINVRIWGIVPFS